MEEVLFVLYPKCSTCQKARKFLDAHKIAYKERDIVTDNPKEKDLKEWHKRSGLPLKRFFNTSGMLYREKGLKDILEKTPEQDWYAILAENGMLVKRPIVVGKDFVLLGFKETEWEKRFVDNK